MTERSWEGFPLNPRYQDAPREGETPPERTPEGHFVMYHGTSPMGARRIMREGHIRPDDLGVMGIATVPSEAGVFATMKAGPKGRVLRVVIDKDEMSRRSVMHEIGGSGHDQFLVESQYDETGRRKRQVDPLPLLEARPLTQRERFRPVRR